MFGKGVQIFAILSLLFVGENSSVQKETTKFTEYEVEVYVGQEQQPDFGGSKTWLNLRIHHSFPYSTGFEIQGQNPKVEILHSLSGSSLSLYFKEPLTNANLMVKKEDGEFQEVKVVLGGIRDDDVTIVLSKHFKARVWSNINPPPSKKQADTTN